jgi:hypothetical protein
MDPASYSARRRAGLASRCEHIVRRFVLIVDSDTVAGRITHSERVADGGSVAGSRRLADG